MKHRPHVFLTAAALTLGSSLVVATSSTATAAPSTCQGKAVTIVATTTVTTGTEGDDVVAMEPGGWFTFDALGGNDTICLALGAGGGGRDPLPTGFVLAGAGDDSVVNLTPSGSTAVVTTVVLGLGNDTFQGAGVGETVFAEKQAGDLDDPYAVDPAFVGAQTDVVTGAARVYSAAPNDGANADRITSGPGNARIVLDGPMSTLGSIDVSAATTAALEVPRPSGLRPAAPGVVTVDNRSRSVVVAGTPVISWTGDIRAFTVGHPLLRGDEPEVNFVGSPASEALTLADVPVGDVSMDAGDDALIVEAYNTAFALMSADAGPGDDSVAFDTTCRQLVVALDRRATCDGASGPLTGFESANASSRRDLTLIGTRADERLVGIANAVTVIGAGGADQVIIDDSVTARVHGGTGDDRISASGDDVVVRGQAGRDQVLLLGTAGMHGRAPRHEQQVALGGRGADALVGTSEPGDRLLGGPGRDSANGRAGKRDFCRAEKTVRCELP